MQMENENYTSASRPTEFNTNSANEVKLPAYRGKDTHTAPCICLMTLKVKLEKYANDPSDLCGDILHKWLRKL